MSRRPTMEDVAARAGVSRALVSLVMRSSPKVGPERRQAVLDAAAELGYRPHALARSLASRRTGMIGVLLSDLHNPFFAEIFDGLEAVATEAGAQLLATTGRRHAAAERAALESLIDLRVDGLVLTSPRLATAEIERAARDVPIVVVSRPVRSALLDCVTSDDQAGAALVVDHLRELGHRRIAHIGGGNGAGAAAKRRGWESAMRRAGLAGEARFEPGNYTDEAGAHAVTELLSSGQRPTAVFAANDLTAIGALGALEESGLRVPRDMSLVGYDNSLLARLRHVRMTTIDQPRRLMGETAMTALLERIGGRREPVRHTLPPSLVTGVTTARPRRVSD